MSDNQYPDLPEPRGLGIRKYSGADMRAYVDADRAQRKPLSDDLCDTITHAVIQEYKFGYPEYHGKFKEECRTAIRSALGMKAKP